MNDLCMNEVCGHKQEYIRTLQSCTHCLWLGLEADHVVISIEMGVCMCIVVCVCSIALIKVNVKINVINVKSM